MTREEWALAYILRFGVQQISTRVSEAEGEEKFMYEYTAAFGLRSTYCAMMRDMFETFDKMGIDRVHS